MVKWIDIEGDEVAVKKDRFGWRVVNPNKNRDGTWNYWNLFTGGTKNLIFTIIVIVMLMVTIIAYRNDINEVHEFYGKIANGEYVCYESDDRIGNPLANFTFNFSGGERMDENTANPSVFSN